MSSVLVRQTNGTLQYTGGLPVYLTNAADISSSDNSTLKTLFTVPVLANTHYAIEWEINVLATDSALFQSIAGGYQVYLTFPASPTQFDAVLLETFFNPNSGSSNVANNINQWPDILSSGDAFAYGDATTSSIYATVTGKIDLINGANAGNLVFKGTQLSTYAPIPTIFRKSSWVRYTLLT